MDFLGIVVIAAVTAVGGGMLRDILLTRHPIFWIADPTYLFVVCLAAGCTLCYVRVQPPPGNTLFFADALGLALFTISGTQTGEAAGLSPIIAVLMGTITGVAGGMMRDILSAETPLILHRDIYATAAIAGSSLYLLLKAEGLQNLRAFGSGMTVALALPLIAMLWGLRLRMPCAIIPLPKDVLTWGHSVFSFFVVPAPGIGVSELNSRNSMNELGFWILRYNNQVLITSAGGNIFENIFLPPFDPLGVEAIFSHSKGKRAKEPFLTVRGTYRWVRHPLYFLSLVMIWSPVFITADRLLFNGLWTFWIITGAFLEERDPICFLWRCISKIPAQRADADSLPVVPQEA